MSSPWMVRLAALVLALAAQASGASLSLTGRVVDDDGAPIANARVSARAVPQAIGAETYTNAAGAFDLPLSRPGQYLVSVERLGYFRLTDRPVDAGQSGAELTLVLNPQREVFQSVDVGASSSPVDPAVTTREQRLSGTEINDVPYHASHSFRNSLALMPGVIQDRSGGVHVQGGAEYQTQYTLDGFDVSDPISGRFSTLLAVEGIRSFDLLSSRVSPEYGRGSAGTLAVHPDNGTDQYHFTVTNFIPGISTQDGLALGGWTPRAGFSGPIVKGRAWFSDSFNGEYNPGFVKGLPKGQDTNLAWVAGNLLHAQVNLTSANIVFADFLSDFSHQNHFGLGALDPIETTTRQHSSEWLTAAKDQQSWSNGALLEAGFAWQVVDYRAVPQGDLPYILSPMGRGGNYFVDSLTHGTREQLFGNLFAPVFHLAGQHQVQVGLDSQRLGYTARISRTSFQALGLSGLPLFDTSFTGSGNFNQPDTSLAYFVNDHWQPFERFAIDLGLREDWDQLIHRGALAPRVSFSYSPFHDARTKLTAGVAVIHEPVNLALFSRPLDQQAITTPYTAVGVPEAPLTTTFLMGHGLKLPRYTNWSAGVEHDFGHGLSAKAEWLQKRGHDGFVYTQQGGSTAIDVQPQVLGYGFGADYVLSNLRRDAYDETALTVRQSFSNQYEWMASYVRSRAVSNAVLDVSVDQPLQVTNNFGRMPWDAPNRLLSWAYLPFPFLSKNWAVAYLVDWRTGFPFAVTDDAGIVSGGVDSHRYPTNFDLNLYIERRFMFRGYRFALRGGVNNLTDHANPTAVNTVIGAPNYLMFYGDEGRHFEFRLRMFGKQTK